MTFGALGLQILPSFSARSKHVLPMLIEPSLHKTRSPPAMPPFLPEQGVSAAIASRAGIPSAAPITKHRMRDTLRSSLGELFILAYKGSPTKTARPLSPSHPVGGDQLRAADLSGRWMTRRRSKHSPIASSATASSLVLSQLLTL